MKIKMVMMLLAIIWGSSVAIAEKIKVGLEAFPPLIVDASSGYTIEMLKEIEKISDLEFQIALNNYSRVKVQLETQQIDLMGHMAIDFEQYDYALPLAWSIPSKNDVFSLKPENVNPEIFVTLKRIGIPRGNKEATGAMIGAPLDSLRELNSMDALVQMLKLGRVDAISFERASVMTMIQKTKLPNVHYQLHPPEPIATGLGVQNNAKGKALKQKLESLIRQLDQEKIFGEYLKYVNLPDSGIVPLSN